MFTVLIPAFNRPELLRNALTSVAQQTAVGMITEVIVSENGQNRGSEQVCNEFEQLPIRYVYHEQRKPVMEHLAWILSQVTTGYVAMLCDDDWWDVQHLQLAQQALTQQPDSVAYFANYTHALDMASVRGPENYWARGMHFGVPGFANYRPNTYATKDVLLLCLLFTPFHFSALVGQGQVLQQAVGIFSETHPAVADRVLWAKLATYGPIIFNPLTTAIILRHAAQDSHNYSAQWQAELQAGAFQVLELAKQQDIDLPAHLNAAYTQASADDAAFIRQNLAANFYQADKLAWFKDQQLIAEMNKADKAPGVKQLVKRNLAGLARRLLRD